MAAGSGSPDRTCVVHHRTDELLIEQHTVSDGQTASPVKERAKQAQSFSSGWHVPTRLPAYQGSPQDSELFRPTVLALRGTALVWAVGRVSRPWQRAQPCCLRL
jgi:hypothetical protein